VSAHGRKVDVELPRVRELAGEMPALWSWRQAMQENWLGECGR
jgi:hypothetical protein